jgi:hypothetical protein
MDTVLLVVTVLSLATAAGLAIVVVRLVREEQRRSEARSALLAEMAAQPEEVPIAWPRPRTAPSLLPEMPRTALPSRARVHPPSTEDDLDLRSTATVVTAQDLFASPESASPAGRRFVIAAGLAALVLAAGFIGLAFDRRPDGTPSANRAQVADVPTAAAPLELVSLRHSAQDTGLTITGVVQNPRTGAAVSRIVATAFVFGPDGAFLSSARAPLDFTTLSPGEESPFVITVPVTSQIARYRVGFRTESGAVVPHVDGRGPEALARK